MKFMVGCKFKYLFSLPELCPYWRERGENNLSFTLTQCGCTFDYKSSVPEIWPFKSRRQLLTIISKDKKQCSVLHKELRVKTFPSIFKISFQNTVETLSMCICIYIYIYMLQSTKNCSLCTLVGFNVMPKEHIPIWMITYTYPSFKNTEEISYLIVGLMRLPMQIYGLHKMIQLIYERHHSFTELFNWTFLAMFIKVHALSFSLNWRVWAW